MEWNKQPCPYVKTVLRQVQKGEQTQELRLPEEMPDIGRVLCSWGQTVIRNKEWRGDQLSVSGGVTASVLYVPENTSEAQTVALWLPFQMKWTLPHTQREGTARVRALLQGLDARILSARKIMLRSSVSILCEALEKAEAEIAQPADTPEGVELLTNVYPAVLPREAGEKLFSVEDEVHIPNVKKWISFSVEPELTEQSVVGSRAVLRGNGKLHYLYFDQEGRVCSGNQEMPFAQFVDLDREYESEAAADVLLSVTALETEVTDDRVKVQCGLDGQYVIWDRVLLEVVEDAYSPMCALEIQMQDLKIPMELENRTETFLPQCQFREGNIQNVTFFPDHPTAYREGERVSVGLSGEFQILYADTEGVLQCERESWTEELAFPVGENAQLNVGLQIVGAMPDVQVKVNLQTVANPSIPMVAGITAGEMKTPEENRPTLILRRMEADSLWLLAKESGSTVAAIRKANGLTQEPEWGQMLLIPIA